MKKYILFVFVFLLYSYSLIECNEYKQDKYSFLNEENGWIIPPTLFFSGRIDTAQHSNTDSVLHIRDGRIMMRPVSLIFNINNSYSIPKKLSGKEIKMSINNKCLGLEKAIVRVSLFDVAEQLTDTIIVDINTPDWELKELAFVPSKNIKHFNIEIEVIGSDDTSESGFWLDNQYTITEGLELKNRRKFQRKSQPLNNRYAIPITNRETYDVLKPILNKKVLALGETLHGSATLGDVAYEITKQQIKNNNCRFVLLEFPIDEVLYLNLYVQGKLPESSIEEIQGRTQFLSATMPIETYIDFIQWLKAYNETTSEKVSLLGFDLIKPYLMKGTAPLLEYVTAHLNSETQDLLVPLIRLMLENNSPHKVTEYIEDHPSTLSTIFGEKDFEFFKYCWSEDRLVQDLFYSGKNSKYLHNRELKRDYYMWLNTKKILDTYDYDDSAKIVLMGHAAHLNKLINNDQTAYNQSLGRYLAQYFQDDYQVVALTSGKGQRIAMGQSAIYNDTLLSAIDNSFEKAAQEINIPYFYYPSDKLNDAVFSIRDMAIGRTTHRFVQSEILNKRLDGILYIDESFSSPERLRMCTLSPDSLANEFSRYLKRKREARDSLLINYGIDIDKIYQ